MRMHDPEKADLLRDQKILIQACHESHESLALFGRKTLSLCMPPAKKAA